MTIERVLILLGQQSVRITERHYAPWVRSRQEQLQADLAHAGKQDPLIALQREVHAGYTANKPPLIHFTVRILKGPFRDLNSPFGMRKLLKNKHCQR